MNAVTRWTSLILGATIVIAALSAPAQEDKPAAVNLESELAKQSYAAGAMIGKGITEPGLAIDMEAFIAGFRAAFKGEELAMTEEDAQAAFGALQQNMRAAAQEKAMAAATTADAEGKAYLTENAKKEGVKTTESGLQYKVIKEGDGAVPTAESRVSVHYKGTFVNGEEFDRSGDTPAEFVVSGVIPGWTEALQLMKVGSKWELVIPSELAYGRGRPGIPPNSVLLFEVELLNIIE